MRVGFVWMLCASLSGAAPLTQKQACEQFSNAVVSIKVGSGETHGYGTGFLVSEDGYVLTASHVVRNGADYFTPIEITLASGETLDAAPASPVSIENVGKDFALLKVTASHSLSFLRLGSFKDATAGADATIIGFPFAAFSHEGQMLTRKLCMSAGFAAADTETVTLHGTQRTATGTVPAERDVHVDVIYFQGPSIKGLSGAPLISRNTGLVVGIVSTKLSGISPALDETRKGIQNNPGIQMKVGPVDTMQTTKEIISILDNQLANGLGSATGIDTAKEALKGAESHK